MAARRFYCDDLAASSIELDPTQSQHARKSLRLAVGDRVELFDGAGMVADGTVAAMKKTVTIDVVQRRHVPPVEPAIDLAVALPKGARGDVLIEKASELGADRVIPLLTQRSVVELRPNKRDRFDRLCIESAKQCGRAYRMHLADPTPLDDLLTRADHDLRLIADPAADVQDLHTSLSAAARVLILIGPEGGWTQDEHAAAIRRGATPMRLGPHVMRIETAALAALAIVRQPS